MRVINQILKPDSNTVLVIISVMIVTIVIDTSIVKLYIFTYDQRSSNTSAAIFAWTIGVYAIGQFVILRFVKHRSSENVITGTSRQFWINRVANLILIIQYVLVAILVSLLLEMIITSSYSLQLLSAVLWISEISAIGILAFLSQRFFSWYRSKRNYVVLGYGLAVAMLSINGAFTVAYVATALEDSPLIITPIRDPAGEYFTADNTLYSAMVASDIIAFSLTWFATALLMKHHAKRLGKVKYWIIVSIPLVYFSSQFLPLLPNLFADFRILQPYLFHLLYTLFFSITKPIGAVLFGVAFLFIARALNNREIKFYMMISSYGMMLLFSSNQASVLEIAPYPPFGLATVSYIGLASYLLLIGIYSCARSLAKDVELRNSIRASLKQQSRILETIGLAETEQEVEKRVRVISKNLSSSVHNEPEIQSSLQEQDIRDYLNMVIDEIRARKVDQTTTKDQDKP